MEKLWSQIKTAGQVGRCVDALKILGLGERYIYNLIAYYAWQKQWLCVDDLVDCVDSEGIIYLAVIYNYPGLMIHFLGWPGWDENLCLVAEERIFPAFQVTGPLPIEKKNKKMKFCAGDLVCCGDHNKIAIIQKIRHGVDSLHSLFETNTVALILSGPRADANAMQKTVWWKNEETSVFNTTYAEVLNLQLESANWNCNYNCNSNSIQSLFEINT